MIQTVTPKATPICPICQSGDHPEVVRVGIRENPEAEVYRCACGLEYITPPFEDPRAYYSLEYRKEHNPVPWAEMTAGQRYDYYRPLMPKRLPHFQKFITPGVKVFEVGCSAGHYLDVLNKSGYAPVGCDYNAEDVEYVNKVLGIPCEEGDIETAFPGKKFPAICCYHVLEHVVDPVGWLRTAYSRLETGGILYVQVPNLDDALHSVYKIPEFDQRWYREPHLSYFNAATLKRILAQAGFEVTISYDQLYSMGNHFSWVMTKKPMPDPATAQEAMVLASDLSNTFEFIDKYYRRALCDMGIADCLIAVGRKL